MPPLSPRTRNCSAACESAGDHRALPPHRHVRVVAAAGRPSPRASPAPVRAPAPGTRELLGAARRDPMGPELDPAASGEAPGLNACRSPASGIEYQQEVCEMEWTKGPLVCEIV